SEEHTSELQSHLNQTCALPIRSEEHTSELQSHLNLVCRLLLEKKNSTTSYAPLSMRSLHRRSCTKVIQRNCDSFRTSVFFRTGTPPESSLFPSPSLCLL